MTGASSMTAATTSAADGAEKKLLSLNSDLLRSIAYHLPPASRVALSHVCKTLYEDTWSDFGLADLLSRFPFEQKLYIPLVPSISISSRFRVVPERASQSHVYAAVADDGRRAAVLAYDNTLRIIDTHHRKVVATHPLPRPAVRHDIWDNQKGVRKSPPTYHPIRAYSDAAAIDAECTLSFTDPNTLMLAAATYLDIFHLSPPSPPQKSTASKMNDANNNNAQGPGIAMTKLVEIEAKATLAFLRGLVANLDTPPADGIAGSAAVSPDGSKLAWIMYAGWPARAYLTIWDLNSTGEGGARKFYPVCTHYVPLGVIPVARESALAWARPIWRAPNMLAVVLNSTQRRLHTERYGESFRRYKLCRFRFFAICVPCPEKEAEKDSNIETGGGESHTGNSNNNTSGARQRHPVQYEHAAERHAWLKLTRATYPTALAMNVEKVLVAAGWNEEEDGVITTLNTIHTCPAEATYKALTFGENTRHPWYVAKQPVYSLLFGKKARVLVAAGAHGNVVEALEKRDDDGLFHPTAVKGSRRKYAFHGLPWRASFAAGSAFSPKGRWLVGVAINNDQCYVCVRNITDPEYSGAECRAL